MTPTVPLLRSGRPLPSRRSPRRVLLSADTVGGVWTHALDLARGLGAAGVEVVLATMGAPVTPAQRAQLDGADGVTLEESSYKLEWMPDSAEEVAQAGDWLLGLAEQHAPDLIHLNGYAHAARPWPAPVLVGAHSCVPTWWQAVHGETPPSSFHHYVRALRQGVAAADLLVAPTAAYLREFCADHQYTGPAEVIPNGRDPAAFRSAPAKAPVFFTAGRLWDEAKNVRLLAELAPALPWPVRVAGDATAPGGARADFPHVELLGLCDATQVADEMAQAAVYVSPARYEPFGLSILEAACSGCVLVLADLPSLREVWQEAALYVSPTDAVGWERTLRWVAADATARADWAARARQRAQCFTADTMTRRYLEVYGRLREAALRRFPDNPLFA